MLSMDCGSVPRLTQEYHGAAPEVFEDDGTAVADWRTRGDSGVDVRQTETGDTPTLDSLCFQQLIDLADVRN